MSNPFIDILYLSVLHSAHDLHELFRQLGYPVVTFDPFESDDLDALDLNASRVFA